MREHGARCGALERPVRPARATGAAHPVTIPATDLGRRAHDLGLRGHEVAKLGGGPPASAVAGRDRCRAPRRGPRRRRGLRGRSTTCARPNVYGLIRRILRDAAQSDEVLQEVMLEIWRLAPRFDPTLGSASAWIMTIAHRRAVDRVRSEVAERGRVERADSRADVAGAPVDEDVIDELDRQRVRVALDRLTDLQRSSIELAYFGGLTQTEIAEHLDVPLGTVKTRIRDGLIRLRDELGEGS